MLKNTLIGAATASLIAAGSLAATTSSASANGIYVSGPNFAFGFGNPGFRVQPPHKVCQPVFKTVQWWQWGQLRTSVIKIGEKCYWTGGNPGPFPPKPGPWAWQQGPHW